MSQNIDLLIESPFKIGQIISSMGYQIAGATLHEWWDSNLGKLVGHPEGKASIRLVQQEDEWFINTNRHHQVGIVCLLPKEVLSYGIAGVRITQLHHRSVEAIPIRYVWTKQYDGLEWDCYFYTGLTVAAFMERSRQAGQHFELVDIQ